MTSPSPVSGALALFDLDHTLIPLDSDVAWGEFLVNSGLADAEYHRAENERFYQQYVNGTLDTHEFLRFACSPLLNRPMAEVEALRAKYFATCIAPHIHPQAQALVKKHQLAGDLCAIVTATNSFVTAPIAKAFGITHLIGTDLEIVNNSITGRALGTPSFREGKIIRTEQWLAKFGKQLSDFTHSWFYSDSQNDLPLMQRVSHPVATNPNAKLLSEAHARHWPVLRLFESTP